MMFLAFEWLALFSSIGLAFFSSRWIKHRHVQQLQNAEQRLARISLSSASINCQQTLGLVGTELVISLDAFTAFSLWLRTLLGGNSAGANELLQRGRREAVIRLKREAVALGAKGVMNLRFEQLTFSSGERRNQNRFSIQAYGTAYL